MNPANTFDPQEYVQQIHTLKAFLNDDATPGTIHEKVKAIPRISSSPGLWMLTSSGESAYLAAHFGMALSFAQFINPVGGPEAIHEYRKRFKPSVELAQPKDSVGIFAFCADTEEKAARMQAIMDYRLISLSKGQTDEAPSYDSVRNYRYTDEESRHVKFNRQRMIVGTRDVVKEKMITLARDYNVNEIVAAAYRRRRSPKLPMNAFAPMNSWQKSSTSKIRTAAETNRRNPLQRPPPDNLIISQATPVSASAARPYFPI